MESVISDLFPHESFRENQNEVIRAAMQALYHDGYDNVVIDAPVGAGKSSINTTLLRYADDGFYTTPVRSLREQIQNDEDLQPHVQSLKAREDYYCSVGNDNCKECYVNQDSEQSCSEFGSKCTYWGAKMSAIQNDIAVLTFAYLTIDNLLPVEAGDTPVSFDDRETLVVDEAHNLIAQTESLHAGFDINPYGLPNSVFRGVTDSVPYEASRYEDVKDEIDEIYVRAERYVRDDTSPYEMEPAEERCVRLMEKIDWMREQIDAGYPWVVDVDSNNYGGSYVKTLDLTPTNVSSFLKNNIWSRANKRIISTATLPYRGNPEIWLKKVGLDPENTKVITVSMTFPVENRPIYTDPMVCSMSGEGDKDNWSEIMDQINSLAQEHYNQNGLIHTASYKRAKRILDSVDADGHPYLDGNVMKHEQGEELEDQIDKWQESDKDIFLSPSMMEGVDLKDDMCRWQVLLKVPYPSMNSRIEYMLNEEKYGWNEYYERTLLRVVQSYGRAVRSKDDYANYYVLDEDFDKLMKKRTPPEWFSTAITDEVPESKSVFDY